MLRGGLIGGILMLFLVGCDMGGQRVIQERRDRELAQWHKERVSQLASAIAMRHTGSQPGLVIRAYDARVHIVGEVDSYEAYRQVFNELSSVPYAEVHPFALVRQGRTEKQRAKDEEIQRKVSALMSENNLRVYVVDGQVVVEGETSPTGYHERLRSQLADLDKRVPGARPDPYLVIYARDLYADLGDWAPSSYVPLPPVRPASLSGAVTSTLNLGSRLATAADMQQVAPPAKPARPAVASPQPAPRRTEARQRSSGDGMAVFGGLLQAAGQIAQASGPGQGYESGLLMQGVGAVLVGDNAAAQQTVANAERYGENNRALAQQQAALRQQQYLQQQAQAAALADQQARIEREQQAPRYQGEHESSSPASSIRVIGGGAGASAPTKKANDLAAPFIESTCAVFANWGAGVSGDIKKLSNGCGRPIAVRFCFYDDRNAGRCANEDVGWGVTSTLAAGAETRVVNPLNEVAGIPWRVKYRVCEMTDSRKLCLKP